MEKFSKWRDPSTGIQPFLPLAAPSSPLTLLLSPLALVFGLARAVLLLALLLVYFTLGTLAAPIRPLANLVTYLCARGALAVLGWYWIERDVSSAKARKSGAAYAPPPPGRGDLIIANWTGWADVLVMAYLHNPVFLLPVFAAPAPLPTASAGRATGTGSANILAATSAPAPPCVGYAPFSALALMARAGTLPPIAAEVPGTIYPTLAAARRALAAPVLLFPEGTTSNGRAVLRLGDGVLAEDVSAGDGATWVQFVRHAPATALLPAAPCPLPKAGKHFASVLFTLPLPRSAAVRTLNPAGAPSAPSFMPSEILAAQPGGLGAAKAGNEWRDAIAIVLAETGRVRRVPGMGWVEKASFLDYYARARR